AEHAVIEPASVIGQTFVRPALETLVADAVRPRLDEHLGTLVTKQLVRPDPTTSPDAFRFEHILIRDAAYNRLLNRARADLHERFGEWAEQVNRDRNRETEYEEILGYHLEQAYRYLGQLGPLDDHGVGVGVRAAAKLAATGRRAFERGDMAAAANLLERATALRPALDPARLALFPELGRMLVLLLSGAGEQWEEQAHEAARDAIERCQEAGDDAGLARAWRLLGWIAGRAWRLGETADALQRAIECARRAGDVRQERRAS